MIKSNRQGDDYVNSYSDQMIFENQNGKCRWLTTEQAAAYLSISPNALRIMVHREQIQVYKMGRRLRFKFSDCQALIQKKGA